MKVGILISSIALLAASLSLPALADGHRLCVGQSVVYTQAGSHYDAVILELYEDGTAKISFPNGEFSVSQIDVSTLSLHLQYEGGFRLGESVVYTQSGSHYDAVIQELYADGTAQVSFPNSEFSVSQVALATLSERLTSMGGLTLGEPVIYTQSGTHYHAIIQELYADGFAQVSFPNGEFSVSQVSVSTLTLPLRFEGRFSVGDRVVYTQSGVHYDAKIDELYADGTALIEFPNGEFSVSQVSLTTLGKSLSCTPNCR